MGAVPWDSVPLVGSFLRPNFYCQRHSVFSLSNLVTFVPKLLPVLSKSKGLQWVDLTSWEVRTQNIIVGPGTVRRVLLQKTQYHLITNAGVCSVSSEWHCFIPLFDKNKTPLQTLQQRKKRITLLRQKNKIVNIFLL